jgi:RHS repeat-associated protein
MATSSTLSSNPFRFTGREDDGTCLYSYRARYYDPTRSRFVSGDPIGLLGGLNVFSYTANNPIGHFDPLGQDLRVSRYLGAHGAGHVGLGVVNGEGEGTLGYYPDPAAPGNPITGQQGLVKPDDPTQRRGTIVIRTTPEQDLCVERCINSRTASPGTYKLRGNNCKDFVHECLTSCGIPAAGPPAPWGYFDTLRQIHGQ